MNFCWNLGCPNISCKIVLQSNLFISIKSRPVPKRVKKVKISLLTAGSSTQRVPNRTSVRPRLSSASGQPTRALKSSTPKLKAAGDATTGSTISTSGDSINDYNNSDDDGNQLSTNELPLVLDNQPSPSTVTPSSGKVQDTTIGGALTPTNSYSTTVSSRQNDKFNSLDRSLDDSRDASKGESEQDSGAMKDKTTSGLDFSNLDPNTILVIGNVPATILANLSDSTRDKILENAVPGNTISGRNRESEGLFI